MFQEIVLEKNHLVITGKLDDGYSEYEKIIKNKIKYVFGFFSYFTLFYRMPLGSDIHYTGTIRKENHAMLDVDKSYSLTSEKNIFVVDGSVIQGNPIYPGIYIINNAINFGKQFIKEK